MKDLVISGFRLDKNGVTPIGTPSFDQWTKAGEFIKHANGAVHFWIGDWLNYGESHYGETYAQAIEATDYAYRTLSNDKWVASRILPAQRHDILSFSHHQEVADLEPEEQDELLVKAEDNGLTVSEFRKVVRRHKLKLDLPEFTDQQREPIPAIEFEEAQARAIMLIEAVEEVKRLNWDKLHPNAKEFLLSQVKKALGTLALIVRANEK